MGPRRFLIRTFGCQMNEHDSERLAGLLRAEGMEPTEDPASADLVLLNTCCIRENADNKLYGHLGHLKPLRDANPDLQIAVGGCLAQKDREGVRERAPYVDVVFGTHNLGRAPALLREARRSGPVVEILDAPEHDDRVGPGPAAAGPVTPGAAAPDRAVPDRAVPYRAWVTIQTGCNNSCAFCIVPAVRGGEVSRPFDELVEEVHGLAARGVTEITLLGQNVNSYGRDLTRRRPLFADLLRALGEVEGIRRIRFTSPHPKDLRPETIAAMASTGAVCPQLHLPLQSGSDRVLSAMRRGYTAQRYLERLCRARAEIPDLAVTTDIIVGFPGETDDDFAGTLDVVAEAAYDGAYTFIYSPRPGTRGAELHREAAVPEEVVAERFDRLRVVVERSALARHRARIGRVEEVLVEGPSRRQPDQWTGRTPQGKLVHFAPPAVTPGAASNLTATGTGAAPSLDAGSFAEVEIVGAAPHHLTGNVLRVTAPPRHLDAVAAG